MILKLKSAVFVLTMFSMSFQAGLAQSDQYEIAQLFDEADSIIWTRHLSGSMEGLYSVSLGLGYDGYSYRGVFKYSSGQPPTYLSGKPNGQLNSLQLEEIDDRGRITGYVTGELAPGRFSGMWRSIDGSRVASLDLMESNRIPLRKFEPRLVASHFVIDQNELVINLMLEAPEMVSGIVYLEEQYAQIIGECEDKLCDRISVKVVEGKNAGCVLQLHGLAGKEMNTTITWADGRIESASTRIDKSYPLARNADCTFSCMYDYTMIVTGVPAFDEKLAEWFDEWRLSVMSFCEDQYVGEATGRWNTRSSAWIDVYMLNENFLSGICTFYNPVPAKYYSKEFLFDIDAGNYIESAELIRDRAELAGYFSNGTGVQGMKHIVFTEHGIVARSDFDGIHGVQSQLAGYEDVNGHIRRKSILNRIAR